MTRILNLFGFYSRAQVDAVIAYSVKLAFRTGVEAHKAVSSSNVSTPHIEAQRSNFQWQ